jgi:hypothetical protein
MNKENYKKLLEDANGHKNVHLIKRNYSFHYDNISDYLYQERFNNQLIFEFYSFRYNHEICKLLNLII